MVVQNPTNEDPSSYSDLKPYEEGVTVYITAAWNESDSVPRDFTIGSVSASGDDPRYNNKALNSNTRYGYFIRYVIENDVDAMNVSNLNSILYKCVNNNISYNIQPHYHYSSFVTTKTGNSARL